MVPLGMQLFSQPSPGVLFLSSQPSPEFTVPSPQNEPGVRLSVIVYLPSVPALPSAKSHYVVPVTTFWLNCSVPAAPVVSPQRPCAPVSQLSVRR